MMDKYKNYEIIWCGNKEVKKFIKQGSNTKFVERGTLLSIYYAITANYAFVTQDYRDISKYNIFNGANLTQLWHGVPLKKICSDMRPEEGRSVLTKIKNTISRNTYENYNYFISSSDENTEKVISAFRDNNSKKGKIIQHGQPRNDYLINNIDNIEYMLELRRIFFYKYGIPVDKKIVTYLPTFRDNNSTLFSFVSSLDTSKKSELEAQLESMNAVLLEKTHFVDLEMRKKSQVSQLSNNILDIGQYRDIDTQELLLVTDLLITDYSSCYFDYLLLDRPIIHFIYDYSNFRDKDRGFYYNIEDVAGGAIVKDENSLLKQIAIDLNNKDHGKLVRKKTRIKFVYDEKGDSCGKISETIIKV